jgi:homoserine kinase
VTRATAFAPATVANVAVGFDVLGFAVEGIGDTVTVSTAPGKRTVTIEPIDGYDTIPLEPARNSASAALLSLLDELGLDLTCRIRLTKGIPLSSGLGGSAASAVGAVVAANSLLPEPLPRERLLPHALAGERAASGAAHADNAAPCLYGGLTAVLPGPPPEVLSLRVPSGVRCALVRPHLEVETRAARAALPDSIPLAAHVEQSARLAALLAGCFGSDEEWIRRGLVDRVIEPRRASLVPGFSRVREAALAAGALGCSLSGSGPTLFAWCPADRADGVARSMRDGFGAEGLEADLWVSALGAPGASVIDTPEDAAP